MKNSFSSKGITVVMLLFSLLSFSNTLAQTSVVLPGTFQSEVSNDVCSDWMPDCFSTELVNTPGTNIWEGSFTIPAGCWEYKVAIDGSWIENYGEGGIRDGANIQLYVPETAVVTFQYDAITHLVTSSPYSGVPQTITKVSLFGDLQSELGCSSDFDNSCDNPALNYNSVSGKWEGGFNMSAGCHYYQVKETAGCSSSFYGREGELNGLYIFLYIPSAGEINFSYDPQTHIINSTPYSGAPVRISLYGTLQSELGCSKDYDTCDNTSLIYNGITDRWEGKFTLPAGCYSYFAKESAGCSDSLYGENGNQVGNQIQLQIPTETEINFSYDAVTHVMSSTPYSGALQTLNKVTLIGDFQTELGCGYDNDHACDNALLTFNSGSGEWEGKYTIPGGCYQYHVKETAGCSTESFYGENGVLFGEYIRLYVPVTGEISFAYNPQTHIISSSPFTDPSQAITVSLYGDLQSELGCAGDYDYYCNGPALSYNTVSGKLEGKFTLPAGCYQFKAAQTMGCDPNTRVFYGPDGTIGGNYYQLYVPVETEITFTYDPETHIITPTPVPLFPASVSFVGSIQNELGCSSDYDYSCDNPALTFNTASGKWEGTFTVPAGCYQFQVKETVNCFGSSYYGDNGVPFGSNIQLYVPVDGEITFSYDPQTHILSSTPYSGDAQTIINVSLYGSLQSELVMGGIDFDPYSNTPALTFNAASGKWEATFNLPAGCYQYQVKESIGCFSSVYYGNNNPEAFIQMYVPTQSDISFSYDPQTHIMSTTPDYVPQPIVSLYGTMQTESGCLNDFDYNCNTPALSFNAVSGKWEGKFIISQGCTQYYVKELNGCEVTFFGNNGIPFSDYNLLYLPSESEIDFSYDPQTHVITTSPYNNIPVTDISLVGDMQSSLGCFSNWDYSGCNSPALNFNPTTGLWEGTFYLDAGCYKYVVKKTEGCYTTTIIGKNGAYGDETINYLEMYLPTATNVIIKFDPVTNLITGNFEDICIPGIVNIPGSFQSELGCQPNFYTGDWEPACEITKLTFDPVSKLFTGTFNIPAGSWEYKIAYNNSWVENYGLNGEHYGPNIPFELCEPSSVTFSYNYKTHLVNLTFNPTSICISKFYDANVNGINDDTIPVAGIKFKLSGKKRNSTQFTGSDGRTSFSGLDAGNYTVTEKLPYNWAATTPPSRSLELTAPVALSFGNVCLGCGGGHNKNYWTGNNGKATLNDDNSMTSELSMLSNLNLRNAYGSEFDPSSYWELKNWMKRVNSRNMAYALSVQLAILQLNVEAGFVSGTAIVYAPGCGNMGYENAFISVNDLISKANLDLSAHGYTRHHDVNRSNQECLSDAIENANNDQNFVQPIPCNLRSHDFDRPAGDEQKVNTATAKAMIWPNPAHDFFTLKPATAVSDQKVLFRVFDANGRQVYSDNGSANKNYRFGDSFKPGLYLVEILQGNKRETFKLIKL